MKNVLLKKENQWIDLLGALALARMQVFVCTFRCVCVCMCTYLGDDGILCEIKENTAANVVQVDVELYLGLARSFSLTQ